MPLTILNPELDDVALSRTELVEYLDVDGNTLYGILYYPVGYEAGRAYPLVAEIYEEFFDNGFNENMNLITAQGWFGFRPSVRFEEGYPGEAWLKAVPNAINKLIERGLVDRDKVGVYGQSYGGYAVNLLITQTDRFAAAANVSGKVNIISFLGDSPKITTRNYAAAEIGQDRIGATLWEQPHKYIAHVGRHVRRPHRHAAAHALGRRRLERAGHEPARDVLRAPPAREGGRVGALHAGGHGAGRASTVGGLRRPLAAHVRLVRRALRRRRGRRNGAGRRAVTRGPIDGGRRRGPAMIVTHILWRAAPWACCAAVTPSSPSRESARRAPGRSSAPAAPAGG